KLRFLGKTFFEKMFSPSPFQKTSIYGIGHSECRVFEPKILSVEQNQGISNLHLTLSVQFV
ncbi:MAG: hypothetical protein IJP32_07520, partial [Clostridia bacterium]|nr:hypothetical protein [Clostridia bacterium]